jgi:hypothetical protein
VTFFLPFGLRPFFILLKINKNPEKKKYQVKQQTVKLFVYYESIKREPKIRGMYEVVV